MKNMTELLKGVLEGIVLQKIKTGETYGYEITNYLLDLGFEDIVEGTVYTVLLRLEKQKLVDVEKRKSELGPPRKFYKLNDYGLEYLETFWTKWDFLVEKLIYIKGDNKNE